MKKADVCWKREDGHVLRLARAEDADAYWAGLSTLDAEAALLTGSRDRYEKDEATSFFLRCVDDPDRRDLLIFSPEGAVLGESVINEIDWRARGANFRICIFGAAGRDRGLGSWACALTRDYAFAELGMHRLELDGFSINPRAERVYERARDTLRDPAVRERVWGIGFHWYSGDHFDALGLTHEAFPDKVLIETEYCLGMSRGGAKDGTMQYAREILGDMNNGMQAAVDWNLLLDQTGGPYHYRYTGCAAPVHVNTDTKELTLQPSYYGLAHFSKYIPKGSVRLATSSYDRDLTITAFERPDGKIAVVAINEAQEEKAAFLRMSDHSAPLTLAPRSVATIVIEE